MENGKRPQSGAYICWLIMLKDFVIGTLVKRESAEKIIKYLIYKFFRSNIRRPKRDVRGIVRKNSRFSFKRPFSPDADGFVDFFTIGEILQGDDFYVLRHYELHGDANPLFCVKRDELIKALSGLVDFFDFEYSYVFDKNFMWCIQITGTFEFDSKGAELPLLRIYYPLM